MIRKVVLRNFKRFGEVEFDIPGHVVLAGPNNTGKTTLLQAIAAWDLGFRKWRELNDFNPRRNGYRWQELERLQFSAVAVRSFDLLWQNRARGEPFEIGIQVDGLPLVTLEYKFHSNGSIKVRPKNETHVTWSVLNDDKLKLRTVFIPAMSGLAREERRLADDEALDDLLSQGRPGEILRNLMVKANRDEDAWRVLNETVGRLFEYELLPPQAGAQLICEYRHRGNGSAATFDIASAGSGFLQVLLLLTLLLTQDRHDGGSESVILVDEPDAHLHMLLQRTIFSELRAIAEKRSAQLFVATHSEMIVDDVDSRELYMMYGVPRSVVDRAERDRLRQSLSVLTHSDILEAEGAKGVLYTEDFTDVDILKAFATVLGDETSLKLLSGAVVLKSSKAPLPQGLGDVSVQRHWEMLKLVRADIRALELLDGDSQNRADDRIHGAADTIQRLRWRRYEIESYLIHPEVLRRFIEHKLGGPGFAAVQIADAMAELEGVLQTEFMANPMNPVPLVENYFRTSPVSKELIPHLMQAAGLHNLAKREYFGIAAQFRPEEVHPEVVERLNQIKLAFGVGDV